MPSMDWMTFTPVGDVWIGHRIEPVENKRDNKKSKNVQKTQEARDSLKDDHLLPTNNASGTNNSKPKKEKVSKRLGTGAEALAEQQLHHAIHQHSLECLVIDDEEEDFLESFTRTSLSQINSLQDPATFSPMFKVKPKTPEPTDVDSIQDDISFSRTDNILGRGDNSIGGALIHQKDDDCRDPAALSGIQDAEVDIEQGVDRQGSKVKQKSKDQKPSRNAKSKKKPSQNDGFPTLSETDPGLVQGSQQSSKVETKQRKLERENSSRKAKGRPSKSRKQEVDSEPCHTDSSNLVPVDLEQGEDHDFLEQKWEDDGSRDPKQENVIERDKSDKKRTSNNTNQSDLDEIDQVYDLSLKCAVSERVDQPKSQSSKVETKPSKIVRFSKSVLVALFSDHKWEDATSPDPKPESVSKRDKSDKKITSNYTDQRDLDKVDRNYDLSLKRDMSEREDPPEIRVYALDECFDLLGESFRPQPDESSFELDDGEGWEDSCVESKKKDTFEDEHPVSKDRSKHYMKTTICCESLALIVLIIVLCTILGKKREEEEIMSTMIRPTPSPLQPTKNTPAATAAEIKNPTIASPTPIVIVVDPYASESINDHDLVSFFFVQWGYFLGDCGTFNKGQIELTCGGTSGESASNTLINVVGQVGDVNISCFHMSRNKIKCSPVPTPDSPNETTPMLSTIMMVACAGPTDLYVEQQPMPFSAAVKPLSGQDCGRFNPVRFIGEITTGISVGHLCFPQGVAGPNSTLTFDKASASNCTRGKTVGIDVGNETDFVDACAQLGDCTGVEQCNVITKEMELWDEIASKECFLVKDGVGQFLWDESTIWTLVASEFRVANYTSDIHSQLSVYGNMPE